MQPAKQLVYSGFWRRFAASFIDGIIVGIAQAFLGGVLGIAFLPISTVSNSELVASSIATTSSSIAMIVSILYYVILIGKKGQTFGKMALGIKVVKVDTNQVPGIGGAVIREVVGKFLSAIILGIGYLWMIWDPKKQALHDKIASTVVIRVK